MDQSSACHHNQAFVANDASSSILVVHTYYGIPVSKLCCLLRMTIESRRRGRKEVLSEKEEEELVRYTLKLTPMGHPLLLTQLHLKIAKLVHERDNPFKKGILGWS